MWSSRQERDRRESVPRPADRGHYQDTTDARYGPSSGAYDIRDDHDPRDFDREIDQRLGDSYNSVRDRFGDRLGDRLGDTVAADGFREDSYRRHDEQWTRSDDSRFDRDIQRREDDDYFDHPSRHDIQVGNEDYLREDQRRMREEDRRINEVELQRERYDRVDSNTLVDRGYHNYDDRILNDDRDLFHDRNRASDFRGHGMFDDRDQGGDQRYNRDLDRSLDRDHGDRRGFGEDRDGRDVDRRQRENIGNRNEKFDVGREILTGRQSDKRDNSSTNIRDIKRGSNFASRGSKPFPRGVRGRGRFENANRGGRGAKSSPSSANRLGIRDSSQKTLRSPNRANTKDSKHGSTKSGHKTSETTTSHRSRSESRSDGGSRAGNKQDQSNTRSNSGENRSADRKTRWNPVKDNKSSSEKPDNSFRKPKDVHRQRSASGMRSDADLGYGHVHEDDVLSIMAEDDSFDRETKKPGSDSRRGTPRKRSQDNDTRHSRDREQLDYPVLEIHAEGIGSLFGEVSPGSKQDCPLKLHSSGQSSSQKDMSPRKDRRTTARWSKPHDQRPGRKNLQSSQDNRKRDQQSLRDTVTNTPSNKSTVSARFQNTSHTRTNIRSSNARVFASKLTKRTLQNVRNTDTKKPLFGQRDGKFQSGNGNERSFGYSRNVFGKSNFQKSPLGKRNTQQFKDFKGRGWFEGNNPDFNSPRASKSGGELRTDKVSMHHDNRSPDKRNFNKNINDNKFRFNKSGFNDRFKSRQLTQYDRMKKKYLGKFRGSRQNRATDLDRQRYRDDREDIDRVDDRINRDDDRDGVRIDGSDHQLDDQYGDGNNDDPDKRIIYSGEGMPIERNNLDEPQQPVYFIQNPELGPGDPPQFMDEMGNLIMNPEVGIPPGEVPVQYIQPPMSQEMIGSQGEQLIFIPFNQMPGYSGNLPAVPANEEAIGKQAEEPPVPDQDTRPGNRGLSKEARMKVRQQLMQKRRKKLEEQIEQKVLQKLLAKANITGLGSSSLKTALAVEKKKTVIKRISPPRSSQPSHVDKKHKLVRRTKTRPADQFENVSDDEYENVSEYEDISDVEDVTDDENDDSGQLSKRPGFRKPGQPRVGTASQKVVLTTSSGDIRRVVENRSPRSNVNKSPAARKVIEVGATKRVFQRTNASQSTVDDRKKRRSLSPIAITVNNESAMNRDKNRSNSGTLHRDSKRNESTSQHRDGNRKENSRERYSPKSSSRDRNTGQRGQTETRSRDDRADQGNDRKDSRDTRNERPRSYERSDDRRRDSGKYEDKSRRDEQLKTSHSGSDRYSRSPRRDERRDQGRHSSDQQSSLPRRRSGSPRRKSQSPRRRSRSPKKRSRSRSPRRDKDRSGSSRSSRRHSPDHRRSDKDSRSDNKSSRQRDDKGASLDQLKSPPHWSNNRAQQIPQNSQPYTLQGQQQQPFINFGSPIVSVDPSLPPMAPPVPVPPPIFNMNRGQPDMSLPPQVGTGQSGTFPQMMGQPSNMHNMQPGGQFPQQQGMQHFQSPQQFQAMQQQQPMMHHQQQQQPMQMFQQSANPSQPFTSTMGSTPIVPQQQNQFQQVQAGMGMMQGPAAQMAHGAMMPSHSRPSLQPSRPQGFVTAGHTQAVRGVYGTVTKGTFASKSGNQATRPYKPAASNKSANVSSRGKRNDYRGSRSANFGRSSGSERQDKSEEYEEELVELLCSKCDKVFLNREAMRKHKKWHDKKSNNDDVFRCDMCEQAFANSHMYETHARDKHEFNSWCCNLCDKDFDSPTQLERHFQKIDHQPTKLLYNCSLCPANFMSINVLLQHKNTQHTRYGGFQGSYSRK